MSKTQKLAEARTLPMMGALDIWSISRLPDIQMNVQDPSVPAPAKVDPPSPQDDPIPPDNQDISSWSPEAQAEVKKLRAEARDRRHATKAEMERRIIVEQENAALKNAQAERERKELESKQEWERLYKNEQVENANKEQALLKKTIDGEIKYEAAKRGITKPEQIEAVMKLLDKSGIIVDGNGSVGGVDTSFERLMTAYPTLFAAPPATTTPPSDPTPPADPKQTKVAQGLADATLVPGTMMTYGDLRAMEMGSAGKAPSSGGTPGAKPFDAKNATKEQVAEWRKNFHAKLPKTNGRG